MNDRHLFIIPPGVRETLTEEEMSATITALKQVDACRLPYPRVTMRFLLDDIAQWRSPDGLQPRDQEALGPACVMDIEVGLEPTPMAHSLIVRSLDGARFTEDVTWASGRTPEVLAQLGEWMAHGLITILATRGFVKTTTENKLAKLDIGKPHKRLYRYTTTIALPERIEVDDPDHPPSEGRPKAPHIRRGHTRNQRFGPGLQFSKLIFIEPTLVNADPGFVSTRTAYNVLNPKRRPEASAAA